MKVQYTERTRCQLIKLNGLYLVNKVSRAVRAVCQISKQNTAEIWIPNTFVRQIDILKLCEREREREMD